MKSIKALLALAVLGAASTAVAQNSDGRSYIYSGGILVLPDDRQENSDESFGAMFGYGIPLVDMDLPFVGNNIDLEFTGYYNSLKNETADDRDYQKGLMVDAIYRFSRENMIDLLGFTPYVLAGIGGVQEDIADDSEVFFAAQLGAGVRHFLNDHGTAVRGDVRLMEVFDDSYLDVRFNLGLEVPLTSKGAGDADRDA